MIGSPPRELLDTELVWTLQFPTESEKIVSTVSKSQNGKEKEEVDGERGGVDDKRDRDRDWEGKGELSSGKD